MIERYDSADHQPVGSVIASRDFTLVEVPRRPLSLQPKSYSREPRAPQIGAAALRRAWVRNYAARSMLGLAAEALLAFIFAGPLLLSSAKGLSEYPAMRLFLESCTLLIFLVLSPWVFGLAFAALYAALNPNRLPQWMPMPFSFPHQNYPVHGRGEFVSSGGGGDIRGVLGDRTWPDRGPAWALRDLVRNLSGKPPVDLPMPRRLYDRLVWQLEPRAGAT